jgi:hypothetical protein
MPVGRGAARLNAEITGSAANAAPRDGFDPARPRQ